MIFLVVVSTTMVLAITAPTAATSYTLEECAQYNLPGMCYSTLTRKFQTALIKTEVCEAVKTYIACVENVGCECNLTQSYSLASSLTYMQHYYENQSCPQSSGELADTNGIPCDKWGNTTGSTDGELLVLSLSVAPYIVELDMNCSGIKSCYGVYDVDGALAVHYRNLTQLCTALDHLVVCLENSACSCGDGGNSTAVIRQIVNEDLYFRQTCGIVRGTDLIPRYDIKCNADGTAVVRTVCDVPDPTYKCSIDYQGEIAQKGNTADIQCPATKVFLECVEAIACQCGLIRDYSVYRVLTNAVTFYNRTSCVSVSGAITVTPGIKCPDGTGTRDDEDRIILALAAHPAVELLEKWCGGIKRCYKDLDDGNGVALFEKNNQKLCANTKVFVECVEMAYCQCGVYEYENTTYALKILRDSHKQACFTDSVLREDFKCGYGTIGFKCFDNSDCQVVKNSECKDSGMCDCKSSYMFTPKNGSCTQVSGATTPSVRLHIYGYVFAVFLAVMKFM